MENGFLTLKEAAQYLGLKESNLYLKVERQEILHHRFGRLIRFKKDDLDVWAEGHKVECQDLKKEVKRILSPSRKSNSSSDIDALLKKAIAEEKGTQYNYRYGKPDQIKGLRKEVSNGLS